MLNWEVFEAIHYPCVVVDREGLKVIYENKAARKLYGKSIEGKTLTHILSGNILPQILHMIGVCAQTGRTCSHFIYLNRSPAELIPVELSIGSFVDSEEYLLVILRDLKSSGDTELEHSMEIYRVLRDINNLIISASSGEDMLAKAVDIIYKSKLFPYVAISEGYDNRILFEKGSSDHTGRTVLCLPIREKGKKTLALVVSKEGSQFSPRELDLLSEVVYDLTFGLKRISMDKTRIERSFIDQTTGLPNRYYFLTYLKNAIIDAKSKKKVLELALVDIDRFGEINQAFGYEAGDRVLKYVADELRDIFKNCSFIGRVGADEFCIVNITSDVNGAYEELISVLLYKFAEPIRLGSGRVRITFSVGIASYPGDSETAEDLYSNAELSLQEAKRTGGNTVVSYSESFRKVSRHQIGLKAEIREALDKEEFILYYQPKVELKSGRITGAEALIRWRKNHKIIPPGQFIPIVENSELIHEVGRFVIKKACEQVAEWSQKGINIPVAVNVSPRQIQRAYFTEGFMEAVSCIEDKGLIEVEITESAIMEDTGKAITFMEVLSSYGIRTYIDDFGTGYSSLAYLKKLPVYALKIDREFIKNLPEDEENLELVKTMLSIAGTFGMKTVAEGIETPEQLSLLRELGCDYAQGFIFSPPVPAEEFEHLYREGL